MFEFVLLVGERLRESNPADRAPHQKRAAGSTLSQTSPF
jgi:hypothetical protein